MHDAKACSIHVSSILGQMVKKWCDVLPEGVRALEKFNRENNNVLLSEPVKKLELLNTYARLMRLRNFKGVASGQSIDLTAYKKVFEPISFPASHQEGDFSNKEGF